MKMPVEKPISPKEVGNELQEVCKDLWAILRTIDDTNPVTIKHLHPVTNNLFDAIDAVLRSADSLLSGKKLVLEEISTDHDSH